MGVYYNNDYKITVNDNKNIIKIVDRVTNQKYKCSTNVLFTFGGKFNFSYDTCIKHCFENNTFEISFDESKNEINFIINYEIFSQMFVLNNYISTINDKYKKLKVELMEQNKRIQQLEQQLHKLTHKPPHCQHQRPPTYPNYPNIGMMW